MAWRSIPWADTPANESVSRLSHSQHSIYAGCTTGSVRSRYAKEIEQAMSKSGRHITSDKEELK